MRLLGDTAAIDDLRRSGLLASSATGTNDDINLDVGRRVVPREADLIQFVDVSLSLVLRLKELHLPVTRLSLSTMCFPAFVRYLKST